MNIAFRVDADLQIGTGHFMRCLNLAIELKCQGVYIRFICKNLPPYLANILSANAIDCVVLQINNPDCRGDGLLHSDWLGHSQIQDAIKVNSIMSDKRWDWIIVDHYALDERWENSVRISCKNIMCIDDLADRRHDCSLLLDQNYDNSLGSKYQNKVPNNCRLLLGPSFALLHPDFSLLHRNIKPRQGMPTRALVFFGGIDAKNLTMKAIHALSGLHIAIEVDVVIGICHPYREQILAACKDRGFVCHVQTSRMADLMAKADISIGAGGSACWERCCLGLPTLIVAIADNQINIATSLDSIGAGLYLGTWIDVDVDRLKKAIVHLINNSARANQISKNSIKLVDGLGTSRVSAILMQ